MVSPQARAAAFFIKARFKGRLHRAGDIVTIRKLMTPPPARLPRGVRVVPGEVGGVAGEWVEGAERRATMLYLHGSGYIACSAQTPVAAPRTLARSAFRVCATGRCRA